MSADSLLDTVMKAAGLDQLPTLPPTPRDFVPCGFCGGGSELFGHRGCMACFRAREAKKAELDAEYQRQFPDGPKPIFTARRDSPEEMAEARKVIGREALEKAFGPGGGGIEEVLANCKTAMDARLDKKTVREVAEVLTEAIPASDPSVRRDSAIEQATAHAERADAGWNERAAAAFDSFLAAVKGGTFLAQDFRKYALERCGLPEPPDNRAFGGVIRRAALCGKIRRHSYGTDVYASPKPLWVAA